MSDHRLLSRRAVLAAPLAFAIPVFGQGAYPSRPIRLIVPFPAGAGDQVARYVANGMSKQLGQPIVVENIPGASGVIGTQTALRAPADGYTLVTATVSMVTGPLLGAPTPFDALKDLVPIVLTATAPQVLVTGMSQPFKTFADLLAAAKARPGSITYASAGHGTVGHLFGEQMRSQLGLNIRHVPYKGGGPALTDTIGGQVSFFWDVLSTTRPQVAGGKLRALAITSAQRSPLLPDVPTTAELGHPEIYSTAWFSIMAPAGTPQSIVDTLNAAANRVLRSPETATDFLNMGLNPEGGPPERFTELFRNETRRWAKIIKEANIKAE